LATIAATGGMASATIVIATAVGAEYRRTTVQDSTKSRRHVPMRIRYGSLLLIGAPLTDGALPRGG